MPKNVWSSIGEILENFFANSKWQSKVKQYSLWDQWDSLVGTAVAQNTRPLAWSRNTLVVGVKDSCWMQELKMREEEILSKIRRAYPDLKIEKLRLKIRD